MVDDVREQMDLTNEISEAISNTQMGAALDEDDLNEQLEEMEQEQLNEKLLGTRDPPSHLPSVPAAHMSKSHAIEEDDDEAAFLKLQKEMEAA